MFVICLQFPPPPPRYLFVAVLMQWNEKGLAHVGFVAVALVRKGLLKCAAYAIVVLMTLALPVYLIDFVYYSDLVFATVNIVR